MTMQLDGTKGGTLSSWPTVLHGGNRARALGTMSVLTETPKTQPFHTGSMLGVCLVQAFNLPVLPDTFRTFFV